MMSRVVGGVALVALALGAKIIGGDVIDDTIVSAVVGGGLAFMVPQRDTEV